MKNKARKAGWVPGQRRSLWQINLDFAQGLLGIRVFTLSRK